MSAINTENGEKSMLRIEQLKLRPDHAEKDLENAIRKSLRLRDSQPFSYEIIRQSVDARKKPDIYYVYTVDVKCSHENQILRQRSKNKISRVTKIEYHFPSNGKEKLDLPPVIVGTGPAGLFCGLMLARAGFRPILLERGEEVQKRQKSVEHFWDTGELNPNSNVQFGEGGAGTFSDGKLNTSVKDPKGRIRFVLKTFVEAGADPSILYSYKPHIGTDVLTDVVRTIREEIRSLGGQVLFEHQLKNIESGKDGHYILRVEKTMPQDERMSDLCAGERRPQDIETRLVVLAIGHSARDTFQMLYNHGFDMIAKSFAVGVRVEHPQKWVDNAMYGDGCPYEMPAAPYKLTHKLKEGGGVYSFCMCPGGYVVNASSELGLLAVNGMSYHDRGGKNANSAIVVTVSPDDFGGENPLDGLEFQRKLEQKAYEIGKGKIPVQRFSDFLQNIASESLGNIIPQMKGAYIPANVRSIFPERVSNSIEEGMEAFGWQIRGFSDDDALLSGVESRTSSPVRITRNDALESNFNGIYPCGEGAGYAGGITSAALDGIRVAEAIASKFSIDFLHK